MGVRTGDLLPIGSGLAHIGVEAAGATAFNASRILPYNHIHCLSGVFHDPRLGTSGIIRYSQSARSLQFSVNGGISFSNFQPTLTLQQAYDNGNTITVDSTNGNLTITADTAKVSLATNGSLAPFRIPPINDPVTSTLQAGDIWFSRHCIVDQTLGLTTAQIAARSLGIGTLVFNTGSGLINLSVGSGIGQFSASTAIPIPTGQGTVIPFDTVDISDLFYKIDASNISAGSGIKVMVPGLYEANYNCSYDRSAGLLPHTIETSLLRNTSQNLQPSSSFSYHEDTTHGLGTASACCLIELEAGDTLRVRSRFASAASANEVETVADQCWIVLKYIGPPRDPNIQP